MENIDLIGGVQAGNSYRDFIEKTAAKAKSVIGLVAYWTISEFDMPELVSLISKEDSFVCVDPTPPTDLEKILQMNLKGNNFYAFRFEITSFEYREGLLHSKMFLFDNHDDTAVLVIGSHNMTIRAISGVNIEHSIIINLKKSDDLYTKVRSQIEYIKEQLCDKVMYLPKEEDQCSILILVGDDMHKLLKEEVISIFYREISEAIKQNEKEIYILAIDTNGEDEYLYKAIVKQSGALDSNIIKTIEIEFSERRYAEKMESAVPFLFNETSIPAETLKYNKYFNTLQIESEILSYELYVNVLQKLEDEIDTLYFLNPIFDRIKSKIKLSKRISNKADVKFYKTNFNPADVKLYYTQSANQPILDPNTGSKPSSFLQHQSVIKRMYLKIFKSL